MLLGDTIQTDSSRVIDIIDLSPQEMQLLKTLRSRFKFGEVTIIMRDGVPQRIKRIVDIVDLG